MTATAVTPIAPVRPTRSRTTVAVPTRTAGPVTTVTAVAARTISKFVRTPQLVVVTTVQGAMFLLIFRYVFGGAINSGRSPTSTSWCPASSSPASCSPA